MNLEFLAKMNLKILKENNMSKYTVTYLPFGKEDKEWIHVNAESELDLILAFKSGKILNIENE